MFSEKGPGFFELLRQVLSSTERGYDLLASKFEYTPFRTPDAILETAAGQIKDPVDRIIDFCCGTGAAMRSFHSLCRMRLVGIDMSQGMLEEAKKRNESLASPAKSQFIRADMLTYTLDESFDLALCFGACGHILPRDEHRFVEKVAQCLRPGGRFLFVTCDLPPVSSIHWWKAHLFNGAIHLRNACWPNRFDMFYLTFTLPSVKDLLESHGFEVVLRRDLFPKPYGAMVLVIATLSEGR